MSDRRLVLASGSPRRHALLGQLGLRFDVVVPDVDETARPGEDPPALVVRLAGDKARAVARSRPEAVVLAADTVVTHEGAVLGKPADRDDARRMLRDLRGSRAQVVSGVAVVAGGAALQRTATSTLVMRDYDDDTVERYLATGEADDKAGGLSVQGAAAPLVAGVEGSRSNVVGLPLRETVALLRAAGVELDTSVVRR